MTVQEAREILQEEVVNLSDEEVQEMIDREFRFCNALLDVIMETPDIVLTNIPKHN